MTRPALLSAACLIALGVATPLPAFGAALDLKVTVSVEGIEDDGLRRAMREVSAVHRADEGEFSALASVRRAAAADAEAMVVALASEGYYAAKVRTDARRTGDEATLVFEVDLGPRFTVTGADIRYAAPEAQPIERRAPRPQTLKAVGATLGEHPTGQALQEAGSKLIDALWARGYPAAELTARRVEADFGQATATAVYEIDSGPLSRFEDVVVAGVEGETAQYVRQLRTFEQGDLYLRSDVEEYREALADTGLFREISVQPAPPGYDGSTDVLVEVAEREARTVDVGASFGTDVGPGVEASWQHRNLLGKGERLTVAAAFAVPRQGLSAVFTKPRPRLPGSWELSAQVLNEDTDAFTAQSGTVGASLNKYWLDRDLQTVAGLRYQYADITDQDGTNSTFSAASLPVAAIFNNETSELNPTDGWRGRALVEPFFGSVQFNRVALGGATRVGFGENKSTLFAVRAATAATYGAEAGEIPATERLFAGGGGSIRGYGFQDAGPLNVRELDDGTVVYRDTGLGIPVSGEFREVGPAGGASLAEINLEARQMVTDKIQIAAFVDAGSVFSANTPDFSGDLFTGIGAGVRYFTPVGPIRLDVAVPLRRRKIEATRLVVDDEGNPVLEDGSQQFEDETLFEDDLLGIYIALGQPF